jgi:hypothetical protein
VGEEENIVDGRSLESHSRGGRAQLSVMAGQ